MWTELHNLASIFTQEWLLCGDFNIVRYKQKTSAKNPAKHGMNKFNLFIQRFNLVDPPITNRKFTWSNLRSNATCSRLDRFLYTRKWEETFDILASKTLPRTISDHFPIILKNDSIRWGPTPFRLNLDVLKNRNFRSFVTTW